MTKHNHTAQSTRQTHTLARDDYDREVQTCKCGAFRVLTRNPVHTYDSPVAPRYLGSAEVTDWAHPESTLAG